MCYIPGGYILLSRKLIESRIMDKPPLYAKIWIWLLLNAYHSEKNNIKRGQLVTSIPEIQEEMSYMVGYRKEKPTYKQVRSVIEWLRNPNEGGNEGNNKGRMIDTTKVTHGMLIEICNYNDYQNPKNYERHNERQDEFPTKELRREKEGHNKYKNVKNDKNYKNDNNNMSPSSEIEKIYSSLSDYWKKLFRSYIELYKSKNKSGKITDNRHMKLLNELYQIFHDKMFSFDGEEYQLTEKVFENGVNTIIEKEIDNLNYAKKVWIGRIERGNTNEKFSRTTRPGQKGAHGQEIPDYD